MPLDFAELGTRTGVQDESFRTTSSSQSVAGARTVWYFRYVAAQKPKRKISQKPPQEPVFALDWGAEPMPVHANVTLVVNMGESFAVVFAESLPGVDYDPHNPAQHPIHSRITASVRLPPSAMAEFVRVVNTVWGAYLDGQLENVHQETKAAKQRAPRSSSRKKVQQ